MLLDKWRGLEGNTKAAVKKVLGNPMSNTRIKICGLRTQRDVDIVNEVQPEMIGFIFDPSRRRFVNPLAAENLRQQLDSSIESVGVFVDASVDEILSVLRTCHVNWIQLHGHENNDFIEELRTRIENDVNIIKLEHRACKARIIKAFRVETEDDLKAAEDSAADLVLLDHGIGGTGESFDWSLIRHFTKVRDFMLAGGLSPENVREAIRLARPYAVDASSALETDGRKNRDKVDAFVTAVRG